MRKTIIIVWGGMALLLIQMAGCVMSNDPTVAATPTVPSGVPTATSYAADQTVAATPTVSPAAPTATPGDVAITPRGRVQIANSTLVTDRGTLLRGAYWAVDHAGRLPDREALARIRDLGLNALHLYAERHDDGLPVGVYRDQVDTVVQWCGELGLYCVITIGNLTDPGAFDYDFATAFWNIYAPRYKENTWVVYEIYNEPEQWTAPYSDDTIGLQQDMYDLIRAHAPDTHILLFSYASLSTADAVLQDVQRLDVDWSNASVAWHGYTDLATEETCLAGMRDAGINSIQSELPVDACCEEGWWKEPWWEDPRVNTDKIRLCEENSTSWLSHINLDYIHDDWRFREKVIGSGICWEPDYGTWPSTTCSD